MNDSLYAKLKTVGLEVHDSYLALVGKKETVKVDFGEVKSVGLKETDEENFGGFFSYVFNSFDRMRGNNASGTPSKIYKLVITKSDGEEIFKKIQDFDLISISRALEKLNQNFPGRSI